MRNVISTIAAFAPLALAAPRGISTRGSEPGCTSISFSDFAWNIEAFTYHASYIFSTPAHQIPSGTVDFNITNPAFPDEKISCSGYSTQLTDFFYGDFPYQCAQPDGSKTKTSFAFSRPSGRLDVNQTWTCTDEDPQYPVTFRAKGTANLTLDCKEDNYQNPNWQPGQIYSSRTIDCSPISLPITPYDKSAVA